MVFQYWHLAVLVSVVALVVWGFRVSRRTAPLALAVVLMVISGFLLYTLVLDEPYLEPDRNARLDQVALIGIPAVLAIGLGVLAFKRTGSRRG